MEVCFLSLVFLCFSLPAAALANWMALIYTCEYAAHRPVTHGAAGHHSTQELHAQDKLCLLRLVLM